MMRMIQNVQEEVTIELHRNGEYLTEETIDDSSEWQHTFENLAVYDPTGDRYEYTVEEKGLTDHYNPFQYYWKLRGRIYCKQCPCRNY